MATLTLKLETVEQQYLSQLEYALAFVSEDVLEYQIDTDTMEIHAVLAPDANPEEVRKKLEQLVGRYEKSEFGHKSEVYFEQIADVIPNDAWSGLLERKWATEVGGGHVVLRGDAAILMDMIDDWAVRGIGRAFDAELEIYPSTILNRTLDRCNHFSSFPEHVDFVAHLKSDVTTLEEFSSACKDGTWSPVLHENRMAEHDFAISPSCCYHCYEGMEGWELERPGRCITAVLACHRYEGARMTTLSRLRAFNMREVVWVGHPKYVIESRAKAEELVLDQLRRWGLQCTFETANDMFFTKDYAVKASFQRQQEAKKELRALIPHEDTDISVFSSNFHAVTFGKAFNITVGGRPAASACVAWGLQRFVYAVFSQFGLDSAQWPPNLRSDFAEFKKRRGSHL